MGKPERGKKASSNNKAHRGQERTVFERPHQQPQDKHKNTASFDEQSKRQKRIKELQRELADKNASLERALTAVQEARKATKAAPGDERLSTRYQDAMAREQELAASSTNTRNELMKLEEEERKLVDEEEAKDKRDLAKRDEEEAKSKMAKERAKAKEEAKRGEERRRNLAAPPGMGSAVCDAGAQRKRKRDRARQPEVDAEALAKGKANHEEVAKYSSSKR